jgi:hypothetical protein
VVTEALPCPWGAINLAPTDASSLPLTQILPGRFATGKDASNGGNNDTDARDATHNQQPFMIANVLWDQAIQQGANNAYDTRGSTKYNAYPQHWYWEDQQLAERFRVNRRKTR